MRQKKSVRRKGGATIRPDKRDGSNASKIAALCFGAALAAGLTTYFVFARPEQRKLAAKPAETAAPTPSNSAVATAEKPAPASPEQYMMGGDPNKEFRPAETAIKTATPEAMASDARAHATAMDAFGGLKDGLISLDPVCETVQASAPKFAAGNPAPGTRRMAERLAELNEKMNPKSA